MNITKQNDYNVNHVARTPSGQQEVQVLLDVICSCGGAPPRRRYTSSNLEQ